MASAIFSQWLMWVLLLVGLSTIWGVTLIQKRDPGTAFSISVGYLLLTLITYAVGIWTTSDVQDWCVLNGHVTSAKYEEAWTETYYTTETVYDSKGRATGTRQFRHIVEHPDIWSLNTTVGRMSIEAGTYSMVRNWFKETFPT